MITTRATTTGGRAVITRTGTRIRARSPVPVRDAAPGALPMTRPVRETVATAESLEVHAMALPASRAHARPRGVAEMVAESPTTKERLAGCTTIRTIASLGVPAGGRAGGGTTPESPFGAPPGILDVTFVAVESMRRSAVTGRRSRGTTIVRVARAATATAPANMPRRHRLRGAARPAASEAEGA